VASKSGITENQRLAGIGESFIEARLKSFAQVFRPVYLFEYGIDFYCRLLQDGKPSSKYFWVEAKATSYFGDHWSESIDKPIVDFWLRQTFPVFIAVYDNHSKNCYWASIEDMRGFLTEKLSTEAKTINVSVDKTHILEIGESKNAAFIRKIQHDAILISAGHGIAQPVGDGYVINLPVLLLPEDARARIRDKIRFGFEYLINDWVLKGNWEGAYSLCKILADFDRGHYEIFVMLARICRQLGKFDEAIDNYEIAITICKGDPNWDKRKGPDFPFIGEIIASIEKEKTLLKQRISKN
jgi:tetratricopeptide (TPR) repeat protein